jgi:hypothetical protein
MAHVIKQRVTSAKRQVRKERSETKSMNELPKLQLKNNESIESNKRKKT